MFATFDSTGSPEIEVEVRGQSASSTRTVIAIVDTGFTGFFVVPLQVAVDLGLIPDSSIDVILADGSTHRKLAVVASLHFEGQACAGVMIVEEQSAEALIGMEFLKSFGLTLIVDAVASTVQLEPSSQQP